MASPNTSAPEVAHYSARTPNLLTQFHYHLASTPTNFNFGDEDFSVENVHRFYELKH